MPALSVDSTPHAEAEQESLGFHEMMATIAQLDGFDVSVYVESARLDIVEQFHGPLKATIARRLDVNDRVGRDKRLAGEPRLDGQTVATTVAFQIGEIWGNELMFWESAYITGSSARSHDGRLECKVQTHAGVVRIAAVRTAAIHTAPNRRS